MQGRGRRSSWATVLTRPDCHLKEEGKGPGLIVIFCSALRQSTLEISHEMVSGGSHVRSISPAVTKGQSALVSRCYLVLCHVPRFSEAWKGGQDWKWFSDRQERIY